MADSAGAALTRCAERVATLCARLGLPDDPDCLRALAAGAGQGFRMLRAVRTPEDYYARPLAERPAMLQGLCPGPHCLGKCIVLENRRAPVDARGAYSRFYIVLFQYTRHLSSAKWRPFARGLARSAPERRDASNADFVWGLASPDVARGLIGAEHNGMGPVGLGPAAAGIPIVVDASLMEGCACVCVGGLHPLVKLRVPVRELEALLRPHIADIADPGERATDSAE